MKLFKKDNLFIPLIETPQAPKPHGKWIGLVGAGIFLTLVIGSIFFVNGSLIPTEDDTEYQTSKEILLPMVNVSTLNPLASKDEDTYYISKLIYDSLFTMDKTLTPTPQLVDSYKINRDSKSITLTLKEGVKWHDGKTLKAVDVAYTIAAFQAAGAKSLYNNDIETIDRTTVISTYKVQIFFADGNNMGLDLLTFPILPKHQFDSVYTAIKKTSGFKPIGTGTYKYKKYDSTTKLVLSAFKDYYGDLATNKITFQVLPNKKSFFNLLKASNLSLIVSKSGDRAAEFSGEDVTIDDFPSNQEEYIGFNFSQEDLSNSSVRKAIAYSLNPQEVIDECYYGSGVTNENIYFPGYLGVDPLKDQYSSNEPAAADLLKQAGYKDTNGDNYLENPGGDLVTLRILVNSNNHSRVLAAKMVNKSLKEIGIRSTITKVAWDTYLSDLKSGNFDLYLGGMKLSTAMDFRDWLSGGGTYNYIGYNNSKLDNLLDNIRSGETPEQMKETYGNIREILHDDLPYFCLLYKTTGAISSPALIGDVQATFDDYYKGCETWYCQYEVTEDTTSDE